MGNGNFWKGYLEKVYSGFGAIIISQRYLYFYKENRATSFDDDV
jgi:hypothetical protein